MCTKVCILLADIGPQLVGGSLLAFCSKILGGGGDLYMVLCHSMNAGSVVGIP